MTDRDKLRCPECWGTGIECWSTGIQPASMSRSRECSKCDGTGQIEAPPPTSAAEGPKPTGEQMVCGNDWQRRMLADAPATQEGHKELREALADLRQSRKRATAETLGYVTLKTKNADAILAALQPKITKDKEE